MYSEDCRYSKEHEWIKVEGDCGTVGITDFAQEQLGDIVYVELPEVGTKLSAMGTFGNIESVQVLLSAGAEVNVQDKNGMTPLMWAARWGDAQRVEALVKAGATVTVRDNSGKSALDWARSRGGKAEQTIAILQPLAESEAKSSETGEPQVD